MTADDSSSDDREAVATFGSEIDGLEPPRPPSPEVEPPSAADEEMADPEVAAAFWYLVVVFNVALGGVTIGPMIAFFLGDLRLGGAVFAVGAIAGLYGYVRYRTVTSDD